MSYKLDMTYVSTASVEEKEAPESLSVLFMRIFLSDQVRDLDVSLDRSTMYFSLSSWY